MRSKEPRFSVRDARLRDVEQFSAVSLSTDEGLLGIWPVWIARSFATGQCATMRVRDGHFGGWHIHEFARHFALREGPRDQGDHVYRASFRVWCADRPNAQVDPVVVIVPYKVLPVQFQYAQEKVDPLHVDSINALCESERARLGSCDG